MIETIHIQAKHDDRYSVTFETYDGKNIDHDGYGLRIDGVGGGDYINLHIDNATGKIIGWVPLTDEAVEEILEE